MTPGPVDEPASGVMRIRVPLPLLSPDHLNCYVLRDAGPGVLLVDTGMRGSETALAGGLDHISARPDRVLATHGHVDHWGLATEYADTVLVHPACRSAFEFAAETASDDAAAARRGFPDRSDMEQAFAQFRALVSGVPRRRDLAEGDVLGAWQVLWTPGHAPGHVCLYRASDGVLLAGDHLLPGYTPNVQPSLERPDALGDYLESLERTRRLDVRRVLPAHGEPYDDASTRSVELQAHHHARLVTLEGALAGGPRSLRDLSASIFGELRTGEDWMLADLETLAHLEYLRLRNRATHDETRGWTAADLTAPVTSTADGR